MSLIIVLIGLVVLGLGLDWLKRRVTSAPICVQQDAHLDAHQQIVLAQIQQLHIQARARPVWSRIRYYREVMETLGENINLVSTITPTQAHQPKGEWVSAANADPRRRILYIHGGGWSAGSPKSHRRITDQLAQLSQAYVLAIDYKLLPEHSYLAGLKDCQAAYLWLLEHGPDGPLPADFIVIAGDSAGGTHTLALLTWLRDNSLPAPHAAIALSPAPDLMLDSLRHSTNMDKDALLGPIVQPLAWLPKPLLWAGLTLLMRARLSHPLVSPLRADLQQLPPTLIQASDSEILLAGIQAYTAKAQAAGSEVELHIYPNEVHVWHIFAPSPAPAFADIADFLARIEARAKP